MVATTSKSSSDPVSTGHLPPMCGHSSPVLELKTCLQCPEESMRMFSRTHKDIFMSAKSCADTEGMGLRESEEKQRGNSNTSVFA